MLFADVCVFSFLFVAIKILIHFLHFSTPFEVLMLTITPFLANCSHNTLMAVVKVIIKSHTIAYYRIITFFCPLTITVAIVSRQKHDNYYFIL